jgi:seryl-tRNA synthetase
MKHTINLPAPANEMVQEEVLKQVVHVSRSISGAAFEGASTLVFEAPEGEAAELIGRVSKVAERVQRGLRSLTRTMVFSSAAMATPRFAEPEKIDGVSFLGRGQAALRGRALQLFTYFDRVFSEMGDAFGAEPARVPTLIPTSTLARCDYFRSFPHMVTFVTHLEEDSQVIEAFRAHHSTLNDVDADALDSMSRPEAGLSPAVCYHTYALHANEHIPAEGVVYGVCGKCFRYEASNITDLRRLWDFTMREVVFMGSREWVLSQRQRGVELMSRFLDDHQIAAEIRTASDPFFLAPDAVSKSYFQLSSDTKYEVAALLPDESRLAVGSLNYHSDFFGRAFDVQVEGAAAMHSVCIAFGLERWVHAFVAQHGLDSAKWPKVMRDAREFS